MALKPGPFGPSGKSWPPSLREPWIQAHSASRAVDRTVASHLPVQLLPNTTLALSDRDPCRCSVGGHCQGGIGDWTSPWHSTPRLVAAMCQQVKQPEPGGGAWGGTHLSPTSHSQPRIINTFIHTRSGQVFANDESGYDRRRHRPWPPVVPSRNPEVPKCFCS